MTDATIARFEAKLDKVAEVQQAQGLSIARLEAVNPTAVVQSMQRLVTHLDRSVRTLDARASEMGSAISKLQNAVHDSPESIESRLDAVEEELASRKARDEGRAAAMQQIGGVANWFIENGKVALLAVGASAGTYYFAPRPPAPQAPQEAAIVEPAASAYAPPPVRAPQGAPPIERVQIDEPLALRQ